MSAHLPPCRHCPGTSAEICVIQPGMLRCPCFGRAKEPVGKLNVDAAGQLVWTALGKNNEPRAYHTFVALRRAADSTLTTVPLAYDQELDGSMLHGGSGAFQVKLKADSATASISVDELMSRALAGDEFIYLVGA